MPLFCPYCLTQQAFNYSKCGHCDKDVSKDYIKNARRHPPVWLATFGFPGHGKTNAINSMTMHIENLDKISEDAYYDYLDSKTHESVNEIRRVAIEEQVDVPPTPQTDDMPEPLLIGLSGFPGDRQSTLVIYDLAGQAAITPKENYVRAIQNAKTAWFVISLTDLKKTDSRNDTQPRTINGLFMRYRDIMESLNVSLRGRTILVNYTKADLLILQNRASVNEDYALPPEIRDYIFKDDYFKLASRQHQKSMPPFNEKQCREELEAISQLLRDFTRQEVPGGGSFLNQAQKKYGMNVEFCITSATGGQGNAVEISRHRVLDPLLWSIYLNDRILDQTINSALILDPELYNTNYPTAIYNALSTYGANVTTYHIGERKPAHASGQLPMTRLSKANVPLIGPLIDSLDTRIQPGRKLAIALLGDTTPHDLYDFRFTHWEKNLHIITTHPNTASDWSNRSVIESVEADMGFIVDSLMEQLT